jgi:hypothetical protein
MNRPGHLRYRDATLGQYLLDHARPAFVKTLDFSHDVPLIAIYPGEDAAAALRILRRPSGHDDPRDVNGARPPS